MYSNKIFFSYTLRDSEINKELLFKLKNKFGDFAKVETYFDILDNCSVNHQEYVYNVLAESNILCLIKSSGINTSTWVIEELCIAKKRNMPIIEINIRDIKQILNSTSRDEFLKNLKVKEIMHEIQKVS